MNSATKVLMWGLGLALVLGLSYVTFRTKPVLVDAGIASRMPLQVSVDEDGLTRIKERYVVSAPLAGRLERVTLEVGDSVVARTTVIAGMQATDPSLLDPRAFAQARARVSAAEGRKAAALVELEKANSSVEFAEIELQRIQELANTKSISQSELEAAELAFRLRSQESKAAEFRVQIAEFELELERSALLLTEPAGEAESPGDAEMALSIKAPINGRVLRIYRESASVLNAGESIMEIGDPEDLEVVVDVLSVDAVRIAAGDQVALENWGGENPLVGLVRVVEPSGFTKLSALGVEEQRVNVIVDFAEPPESRKSLGDGFRMDARIIVWSGQDVLCVPASSLFRQTGKWSLFRIQDGRAVLTSVEVGQSDGIHVEIIDGVAEGEVVIVHPSDAISDGAAVEIRPND